eukprot:TRINITY_DN18123_c0_g1_i1.p1 TRINITY_DN18123_c0_g1~~TRINITY_DN18123_c0_g1_i1.p1  ORF type:complete len:109 (+),score=21.35 TRINITY_DN18123_c0_g1_i1:82-408(+)
MRARATTLFIRQFFDGKISRSMATTSGPKEKAQDSQLKDKVAEEEDGAEGIDVEKIIIEKIGNPPEKPLPGDCCGTGCETCVWDLYFDELKRYRDQKDALLKSLSSLK